MNTPKRKGSALRLAAAIGLALLLSGCVFVPYGPYHPPRYGYWR